MNVTLPRDAKVGKISSEISRASRHISMPWSLTCNAVACGPMIVVALFPHRTSHGGSCNEDRRAIYFSRLMQGKLFPLLL